jgi:selenoprotein W-related protein
LKEELGLDAELKVGSSGVFIVEVDGKVVAKRGFLGFPSESEIVSAVAEATPKA